MIRWWGASRPASRPASCDVLTSGGWSRASLGLARYLWRDGRSDLGADKARRCIVRACSCTSVYADRRTGLAGRFAGSGLRWFLSPPLRMGAPRRITRKRTKAAECSYRARLGERASEQLLADSLAGWERARDRHSGIERRSQTFLQAAGLTTTLVLANSALLRGQDRLRGVTAWIVLGALVVASAALLVAGIYGLFGSMRTFGRVGPNNIRRVIERARELDESAALRAQIAANLLAQRRTGLVADWKVARLKRAMWWLLVGVVLLGVASSALVVDALG